MQAIDCRSGAARHAMLLAVLLGALGVLVPSAGAAGGAELWASRYDGPGGSDDEGNALAVSPDGARVYVTGLSSGAGTNLDYATVAYDAASGAKLWVRRYDGRMHLADYATDIAVSPDGSRVFVTGQSEGPGGVDYATVAYDAVSGTMLWVHRYDGPAKGSDRANALALSPDGTRVYVTGGSTNVKGFLAYATVAYSAATGAQVWARRDTGPGVGDDEAFGIAVAPGGTKVYVTGYSAGSGTEYDYATVAYDAAGGTRLWASRYDGPVHGTDQAKSLGLSPDGTRVYVTGFSNGAEIPEYATVAYGAASGAELWASRYVGGFANALSVSPDGARVYVTGNARLPEESTTDYGTVAYAATTGAQLWVARYDGPTRFIDEANAIAAGPDGSLVYVTGWSLGASYDYATVAYAGASGSQVWLSRYDGPGKNADLARALAVGPDGSRVYVTGRSYGRTTPPNYATVAYTAQ